MLKTLLKTTLVLAAPLLLGACNTSTTSTTPTTPTAGGTGVTAVTPTTTMVTGGSNVAPTVAGVSATQILAVAAGGLDASGRGGPFPATISGGDGFQANTTNDASFGTLINSVRAAAGAAPVTYNAQLDAAAQAHSDDMLAQDYFSHTGANGSSIGDRATAAGYNWRAIGENIAQGQGNENLAMNGWISSPGHQANNVRTSFKEFGLGRAGTGSATRWTLVLGAQQ